MHQWLVLLCALALAGCATPAQRAAQQQAEMEEMIQVYGPACEKLGYKRDDDKWRDCVLQLALKAELRFRSYPTTTTCVGHAGFYTCTNF